MLVRPTLLGEATLESPLCRSARERRRLPNFVHEEAAIAVSCATDHESAFAFERAGPRKHVFFDGAQLNAGVVTCGGLCPGMNHVLRSIVLELALAYDCNSIKGYRYGYEGLSSKGMAPIALTEEMARDMHREGGSFIGVSRGQQSPSEMVDTLVRDKVSILFAIGGDGTLRGAHAIAAEIASRNLPIAIVGVPKTIDNDVAFVDRTFGFETAVECARTVLEAAHAEARSFRNGVCVVQLMGRDAGFITASATLASGDVNICLLPEIPFSVDAILAHLERRLQSRSHAVIAIAEGCASQFGDTSGDARGQKRNVAQLLSARIADHFRTANVPLTTKVIDPSYMIRSVRANASDALYCDQLGRSAVHAAMSGRTDLLVGRLHRELIHVPLAMVVDEKRRVDPDGDLYRSVLEATGQPSFV